MRIKYTGKQRRYGIQIPIGTKIGKGLRFEHYGGIVVAGSAVIGDNCTFLQNVTIGRTFASEDAVPVLGNNVLLFAGAKVVGKVKINDNAVVGCNAVVIRDVPEGMTVAGVPANVVSNQLDSIVGVWRNMFSLD